MTLRNWIRGLAIGSVFAMCVAPVLGEDKKPAGDPHKKDAPPAEKKAGDTPKDPHGGQPAMTPEQMKEMAVWMDSMTPGPEHDHLKPLEGNFNCTFKMRHTPDTPWEEHAGTISRHWIMGGRYMVEDVKGPAMFPGAPEMEGMAILGYDKVRKVHFVHWIDNYGTGSMTLTGTADSTGKTITMNGSFADPMTGAEHAQKHVLRIIDDKTHKIEMYEVGKDGKEALTFELTATRK